MKSSCVPLHMSRDVLHPVKELRFTRVSWDQTLHKYC